MCMPKDRGGLGFRDLRCFNLALLAKQGWRLQTNSTSLFSRVYKAKYFPHCNFDEATIGRNPSYAWRSLMAAQGVIRRGMRWQVGTGNQIRVWRDKWIPRPSTYKVITPKLPSLNGALVCELINRETKEWDRDKIEQWFLPEDRDEILGIPLSTTRNRDRIIWAENRSGKFSVKSAYILALEEQKQPAMADCSNGVARRRLWKTIWSLNIPQKNKFFAWKASRDILASNQNLTKRKITEYGVCDLCGKEKESTCHLLWFCDHAKEVWCNSKLSLPFEISESWKFIDVLENLQRNEHLRPGLLEQVTMVCWGI